VPVSVTNGCCGCGCECECDNCGCGGLGGWGGLSRLGSIFG